MLAPLLETQRQRDAPFEIPHFPRRCIYNCKKQLVMPAQKMQKEAVLSHDTRVVELLPFNCSIGQALQNLSNICIDAGIGGVLVLGCHLRDRIFDDPFIYARTFPRKDETASKYLVLSTM